MRLDLKVEKGAAYAECKKGHVRVYNVAAFSFDILFCEIFFLKLLNAAVWIAATYKIIKL